METTAGDRRGCRSQVAKRLSQREQVDPAQLVLEPGFFCTEEGAECTIHREVNAAKPGVVMLTPEIARPWFDETQAISQKELGLIALSASCDCNTASCVCPGPPWRTLSGQWVPSSTWSKESLPCEKDRTVGSRPESYRDRLFHLPG